MKTALSEFLVEDDLAREDLIAAVEEAVAKLGDDLAGKMRTLLGEFLAEEAVARDDLALAIDSAVAECAGDFDDLRYAIGCGVDDFRWRVERALRLLKQAFREEARAG